MVTMDQLKGQAKEKLKISENLYNCNFFKFKKEPVSFGLYYFDSTMLGRFVAYFQISDQGKILSVFDTDKKPIKELQYIVGEQLDLKDLKPYEKLIHNRRKGLGESQILGEICENKIHYYSLEDFLNVPVRKTKTVNGKEKITKNPEYVTIFNKINNRYRDKIQKTFRSHGHGNEWVAQMQFEHFHTTLRLWEFFDYSLFMHISFENTTSLYVTPQKVNPSEYLSLIEEFESLEISNRTKALLVCDKGSSDVRDYSISELALGQIDVRIGYKKEYYPREPSRPYTFRFDFKRNQVECADNERNRKFIPAETARFNEKLERVRTRPWW